MTIPQAFELALQRHQAGRLAEAEALYRQILAVQPDNPDALHHLGIIAQQVGRHELAVDLIRRSILIYPHDPSAHYNIAKAYAAKGQVDDAIAAYRQALRLKPDLPEAHLNLGEAYRATNRLDEAIAAFRSAIQFKPRYPEAYNNLGIALTDRGQPDEAVAACHRALELNPGYVQACNTLGLALQDQGHIEQAIAAFNRALQLDPVCFEALNNLAGALKDQGHLDAAIAAYRRALQCRPGSPEVLNNLGIALKARCELDEAIAAFREAFHFRPEFAAAQSNLIYTLHFHPGHSHRTIAEEHHRWNRQFSDPLERFILPHANDRDQERRLRVGYVSPDFREHVIGYNLLPLFERHDRRDFEILCYSGVVRPDQWTETFRERAQHWRSTVGVGDAALAEMIRQDGVDILVDLTQHMAGNRLPMFARQPAPIQVSFAGYPESTGLEAIGYRISDRYLEGDSADHEAGRRERVCLIDSFWCYDPCGMEVEINPLPALEGKTVTLGNLGNFCKLNAPVLKLWAQVLGHVTDSRLLICSPAGSHRERTLETLRIAGVESRRVEFVEFRPRREYLELYHRLDIILDTFPYNGHTTSIDALWMGVPVVSLAGRAPVSRAGLSQLTNLGLPELVARDESEYLGIAEGLARDLPRLAQLRATLRDRVQQSVLMDAARFTRQVEQAYRQIWRAWCDKQRPAR